MVECFNSAIQRCCTIVSLYQKIIVFAVHKSAKTRIKRQNKTLAESPQHIQIDFGVSKIHLVSPRPRFASPALHREMLIIYITFTNAQVLYCPQISSGNANGDTKHVNYQGCHFFVNMFKNHEYSPLTC